MDLIAVNTIHRTVKPGKAATATAPGMKPEVEIIEPGESFSAPQEEAEKLIEMKAAMKDKGTTAKSKTAKNTKTSSAAAAKQQAQNNEPKAVDDMTVAELKAELDERQVEYASDAKKDDLVTALTGARDEGLV